MSAPSSLSVVVPVYNSALSLERLYQGLQDTLLALELDFEVIFVDDGSQDDSWQVIKALKTRHGSKVKGLQLVRNSGQQAATLCGMLRADREWIATIDDDFQTPPAEIGKLWEIARQGSVDLVYGIPEKQVGTPLFHRLARRIFKRLLEKYVLNFPSGSSFRLIRKRSLRHFPSEFWPWSFVDPILGWQTDAIARVRVEHRKRENGRSGYSFFQLTGNALRILIVYSDLPFKLMIWFGFVSALISVVIGTYYIIQKLWVGAQLGFSALITAIAFSTGIILICLGVLIIYISKMYKMLSGQRAFTVKKEI